MAILNTSSFPPGSSRAFMDEIIRQQRKVEDTSQQGNDNQEALTQVQKAVNSLSSALETTSSTATSALQTANSAKEDAAAAQRAANSAGNGVGDINMNAVFKNVTAAQTVGGPFGASQFTVGGTKVVGARVTGWTAVTGAQKAGGINADQNYPAGAAYSQAEVLALASGLQEARQVIAALYGAMASHGLIG